MAVVARRASMRGLEVVDERKHDERKREEEEEEEEEEAEAEAEAEARRPRRRRRRRWWTERRTSQLRAAMMGTFCGE